MRLFLAVDVDEPTRQLVSGWRNGIVTSLGGAARALRWVDPDQLHLTMRFLGDAVELARLTTALAAPLLVPAFSIAWSTPGWLPPRGRPRVLHIGVGDGTDGLLTAFAALAERLEAIGVAQEPRPFTPHLTVARVRDGTAPSMIARVRNAVADVPLPDKGIRVTVTHVTLYDSQLTPAGPTYRVCSQIALS
ncbi:MAG: RNA 2',3'-cyclic phosphodiesterase [Vicinamibacterales bacterium]